MPIGNIAQPKTTGQLFTQSIDKDLTDRE